MDADLECLRDLLASQPNARLAYVFGSVAGRAPRPGSDIDVAVHFARRPSLEELSELAARIGRATGRRTDLVDLSLASPLLLREVLKEGRLIWAADDDERINFETRALARYMDTAHLRRVQRDYLHAWAEAYRARAR